MFAYLVAHICWILSWILECKEGASSWHDNCAGGVVNRKFSVLSMND